MNRALETLSTLRGERKFPCHVRDVVAMSLVTRRDVGRRAAGYSLLGWSTQHTARYIQTALHPPLLPRRQQLQCSLKRQVIIIPPHSLHPKTDATHSTPAAKGSGVHFTKENSRWKCEERGTGNPQSFASKKSKETMSVRFEAFTVIFMNVIPCQRLSIFRHFGGGGDSVFSLVDQEQYSVWQESRPVLSNVGHIKFLRGHGNFTVWIKHLKFKTES